MNEVLVDWGEGVTYDGFGSEAGMQAGDYGNFVGTAYGDPTGVYTIDVTASLSAWALNPSANRGWIFRPTGTDGVDAHSSDAATIGNRPVLTVLYSNPPTSIPIAPTGLSAALSSSYLSIQLNWTDNADNEANFEASSGPAMEDPLLFWLQWPPTRRFTMTGASSPLKLLLLPRQSDQCLGGVAIFRSGSLCGCVFRKQLRDRFRRVGVLRDLRTGSRPRSFSFYHRMLVSPGRIGSDDYYGNGRGITDAIPLITKGRGESENSNVDMNYFLGIRQSDGVLVADFEEGAAGLNPGLNHPVIGVTPINNNIWYHAAVTYNGSCWQLYLDGNPESDGTNCPGQPPRFDSIQHAGIASAMTSDGTAARFFDGMIDEVHIWNYARTETQIKATINSELTAAQAGLVVRWGLNEGAGTVVHGTAGAVVDGSIIGTNYAWTAGGAPFNVIINDPPDQPTVMGPANGAVDVSTTPALEVAVSDPEVRNDGGLLRANCPLRPVRISPSLFFRIPSFTRKAIRPV